MVESGGEYFIVKVKELTVPKEAEGEENEQMSNFFAMRRAGEAFTSWLKSEREDARIQMNSQLILSQ